MTQPAIQELRRAFGRGVKDYLAKAKGLENQLDVSELQYRLR